MTKGDGICLSRSLCPNRDCSRRRLSTSHFGTRTALAQTLPVIVSIRLEVGERYLLTELAFSDGDPQLSVSWFEELSLRGTR